MPTFWSPDAPGIIKAGGPSWWAVNVIYVNIGMQKLIASISGAQRQSGAIAVAEKQMTTAMAGSQTQIGSIVVSAKQLIAAISASQIQFGSTAVTMQKMLTAEIGSQLQIGSIAVSEKQMSSLMSGIMLPQGTINAVNKQMTSAMTGSQTQTGSIVVTMQALSTATAVSQIQQGAIVVGMSPMSVTPMSGIQTQAGSINAVNKQMIAALAGSQQQSGSMTSIMSALAASIIGAQIQTGSTAVSLKQLVSSISAAQTQVGTLAVAEKPMSSAMSGFMQPQGNLAVAERPMVAALAGGQSQIGTSNVPMKKLTSSMGGLNLAAGARPLIPSDITGLSFWLDASQIPGSPADYDDVPIWTDISGNGSDASSTYYSPPRYRTSAIGGKPALEFDVSRNSAMRAYPNTGGAGAQPMSVFVVGRLWDTSASGRLFAGVYPSNSNWLMGWWGGFEDVMYVDAGGFVGAASTGPAQTTNAHIYGGILDSSFTSFYNVGNLLLASGVGSNINNSVALSGYDGAGGSQEMVNGQIAEVIIFPTALSDDDRWKIEGYLAWKYGMQSQLPSAHVYKVQAPTADGYNGAVKAKLKPLAVTPMSGGQQQSGAIAVAQPQMLSSASGIAGSSTGVLGAAFGQMNSSATANQSSLSGTSSSILQQAMAITYGFVPKPIQFISTASQNGTTLTTMPTHATGDRLYARIWRNGSTAEPTIPSGWTQVFNKTGTTSFLGTYYKDAASSSETMGTWTGATSVGVDVYRNVVSHKTIAGATGSGTTLTYPAITLTYTNGTSWVYRNAGAKSATNIATNTPSGYTARGALTTPTASAQRSCDSNGGLSTSPAAATQTVSGSGVWVTLTLELIAAQPSSISIPFSLVTDNFSTIDSSKWIGFFGIYPVATSVSGQADLAANNGSLWSTFNCYLDFCSFQVVKGSDSLSINLTTGGYTSLLAITFNGSTAAANLESTDTGYSTTHVDGNYYRFRYKPDTTEIIIEVSPDNKANWYQFYTDGGVIAGYYGVGPFGFLAINASTSTNVRLDNFNL